MWARRSSVDPALACAALLSVNTRWIAVCTVSVGPAAHTNPAGTSIMAMVADSTVFRSDIIMVSSSNGVDASWRTHEAWGWLVNGVCVAGKGL
jgi:hypothetical protein